MTIRRNLHGQMISEEPFWPGFMRNFEKNGTRNEVVMKFPYGICDFYNIITEDYYYADRTDRIPIIEKTGKHLLFLRPRRFGKSLLLSMLGNYYDVAKADEFERLFGHLAIGKNPTPLHNRYFVMKWDFSAVSPMGEAADIRKALHDHINGCIERFISDYRKILDYPVVTDTDNALRSFQSVLTAVSRTPYKLYLLIDEYDNFANEVMMGSRDINPDRYKALVYGEGCIKALFKMVKSASAGQGLDRVLITGVSPVVMSDITSGYNIAKTISSESEFNDLCGFSETEIAEILRQIADKCKLASEKTTEALSVMRTFYNGYCFGTMSDRFIYNPTLSLYFLEYFQKRCQYPPNMLDSNLAMDRGKIVYISLLPEGHRIIISAMDEETAPCVRNLADRFGVEEMLIAPKDNTFMASLLYYFGVLTFSGKKTDMGDSVLKIPNLVIRRLYAERIREMFLPDTAGDDVRQIAVSFYRTGNMQPLCEFIEQKYFRVFDNRDYRWANELVVKTAFLTLLFDDGFYIIDSETSLERGYADMTMIVRPDMRQYPISDFLIEFKYVSLKDTGLSGADVRNMSRDDLNALASVKQKLADAESRIDNYCKMLRGTYGDILHLRAYNVAAVGFERLIWEEITNP